MPVEHRKFGTYLSREALPELWFVWMMVVVKRKKELKFRLRYFIYAFERNISRAEESPLKIVCSKISKEGWERPSGDLSQGSLEALFS
jgi:hypothetical protein